MRDHPDDFRSLRAMSWADLALDRKADAINTARRAVELLPVEKDAVLGSGNLAELAEMRRGLARRNKQWRICDICSPFLPARRFPSRD